MANLYNLLLMLDGAIYNLIDYLYDIFDFLAGINIFSQDTYNDIVSRIYIILGVFMLFVLAYSLLKAIINPDDFAKGENSFPNLIKNVVVSLVIIVLLPTVFSVAFNIQNSILNNDTIPKLILGTDYATNTDVYDADAGRTMAYYTFMAFFHENEDWCGDPEVNGTGTVLTVGEEGTCADEILGNGALFVQNGLPLSEIRAGVLREDSFSNFSEFGEAVEEGQINYMFIISTFGGLFILYVLLNFCFDMALRVIKLAFYQIIAPIPVICRILPGGNMKDVFSNWTKQVISIFFEVFIRIGIMNLGVFLITTIVKNFNGIPGLSDLTQGLIVQALLIMGVVTFIRQAPDLLSKLLKLDTGGMKLGLMDKLAMGGVFAAGGAVGSLISSRGNAFAAVRGFRHGLKNKDFRVIGQEANYARTRREARAAGATRGQIFSDRIRRGFGFDTRYETEMRGIDNQVREVDERIEAINNNIEAAKQPLLTQRVNDRINGNSNFIKAKDAIEDRVKKKLNEEKSSYMTSINYDVEVEYDTGLTDSQGNHIMGRRIETRTETGNLDALRKFVQKNPHNLSSEQITRFSQKLAAAEKNMVGQYVRDSVTQTVGTDGAGDHVLENLIADIRSDGVLNNVLMDANGNSQLSQNDRNDILTSANLWDVLDNLGGTVSNEVSALNRLTTDVNQQTIELSHQVSELNRQKQELQAQKVNDRNRAYRASSDIASRPPGGSGGSGGGH